MVKFALDDDEFLEFYDIPCTPDALMDQKVCKHQLHVILITDASDKIIASMNAHTYQKHPQLGI